MSDAGRSPAARRAAAGLVLCWCLAGAAPGLIAEPPSMPAGFEGVRLGMSAEDLAEARAAAAPFDVFGEPETATADRIEVYMEPELTSDFFQQATYTFARERLCAAQFLTSGPAADRTPLRARVLQGAVRKWGEDYARISYRQPEVPGVEAEVSDRPPGPGLHWSFEGAEVLLRFSARSEDEARPAASYLSLTIFDRECLPAPFRQWLEGISPVARKVGDEWFGELETEVSPPLFN